MAGLRLALGVEAQELVGHLADLLLHARLRLRERRAAEAVELRLRVLAARVLLDLVQAIDGEVELVAAGVLDGEEVDRQPADVLVHEPLVPADAVLDVDDEVPDGERAQVLEERARDVLRLSLLAAGARGRRRSPPR